MIIEITTELKLCEARGADHCFKKVKQLTNEFYCFILLINRMANLTNDQRAIFIVGFDYSYTVRIDAQRDV